MMRPHKRTQQMRELLQCLWELMKSQIFILDRKGLFSACAPIVKGDLDNAKWSRELSVDRSIEQMHMGLYEQHLCDHAFQNTNARLSQWGIHIPTIFNAL